MFIRRLLCLCITTTFVSTLIVPPQSIYAQTILDLPQPGTMVSVSPSFEPALIRGLTVHQDNPFLFDFIVDPGQSLSGVIASEGPHAGHSQVAPKQSLKEQSDRMIKYFFAALTIPDKDIWVNLSPYEKDRMIPESLGVTAMGRDLLAQDYMLKQLTASLIYPQKALGKTFWNTVYSKAKEMYGTTQIPVNTFNKVWIVPQKAGVYEHNQTAFIVEGHLKVMLEEDYLSLQKHVAITNKSVILSAAKDLKTSLDSSATPQNDTHSIGSQVIRQIILPEIEKEVNEGKNFATLRQIFYAQVLAVWFKRNLKQALLNQVYANKGTVKGIDQNDSATNEAIYQQYLKAYKKGVFNYIKEDIDPVTQEALPRKYFSGGYAVGNISFYPAQPTAAMITAARHDFDCAVLAAQPNDAAALDFAMARPLQNLDRTQSVKEQLEDKIQVRGDEVIVEGKPIDKQEASKALGQMQEQVDSLERNGELGPNIWAALSLIPLHSSSSSDPKFGGDSEVKLDLLRSMNGVNELVYDEIGGNEHITAGFKFPPSYEGLMRTYAQIREVLTAAQEIVDAVMEVTVQQVGEVLLNGRAYLAPEVIRVLGKMKDNLLTQRKGNHIALLYNFSYNSLDWNIAVAYIKDPKCPKIKWASGASGFDSDVAPIDKVSLNPLMTFIDDKLLEAQSVVHAKRVIVTLGNESFEASKVVDVLKKMKENLEKRQSTGRLLYDFNSGGDNNAVFTGLMEEKDFPKTESPNPPHSYPEKQMAVIEENVRTLNSWIEQKIQEIQRVIDANLAMTVTLAQINQAMSADAAMDVGEGVKRLFTIKLGENDRRKKGAHFKLVQKEEGGNWVLEPKYSLIDKEYQLGSTSVEGAFSNDGKWFFANRKNASSESSNLILLKETTKSDLRVRYNGRGEKVADNIFWDEMREYVEFEPLSKLEKDPLLTKEGNNGINVEIAKDKITINVRDTYHPYDGAFHRSSLNIYYSRNQLVIPVSNVQYIGNTSVNHGQFDLITVDDHYTATLWHLDFREARRFRRDWEKSFAMLSSPQNKKDAAMQVFETTNVNRVFSYCWRALTSDWHSKVEVTFDGDALADNGYYRGVNTDGPDFDNISKVIKVKLTEAVQHAPGLMFHVGEEGPFGNTRGPITIVITTNVSTGSKDKPAVATGTEDDWNRGGIELSKQDAAVAVTPEDRPNAMVDDYQRKNFIAHYVWWNVAYALKYRGKNITAESLSEKLKSTDYNESFKVKELSKTDDPEIFHSVDAIVQTTNWDLSGIQDMIPALLADRNNRFFMVEAISKNNDVLYHILVVDAAMRTGLESSFDDDGDGGITVTNEETGRPVRVWRRGEKFFDRDGNRIRPQGDGYGNIVDGNRNTISPDDYRLRKDHATLATTIKPQVEGGIDLSQQDSALHVTKDANGGVKVTVDPALIARIEREGGMHEVVPVIINMQLADTKALFGTSLAMATR